MSSLPRPAAAPAPPKPSLKGYPGESSFVVASARQSPAAPAFAGVVDPAPVATASSAQEQLPGDQGSVRVPQEDIGKFGDDDTKQSKYYDPSKNKPGLNARENRVSQHPNIPKPLKEALLKGLTLQELADDPELMKLYKDLPRGSDASARVSSLARSNTMREGLRRSARREIEASLQRLVQVTMSIR